MFEKEDASVYRRLNSPKKIQNFLNDLKINFEEGGDTCFSPRMVVKHGKAHCVEGAIFAAAALMFHGFEPLVVDLEANKNDFDHVIAVFKKNGCWGAISKTNHAVLRYREPVYKTIRELVMSYFHEYFTDSGAKTLRRFSMSVNLKRFDNLNWVTSEKELWEIPEYLTRVKHFDILTKSQLAGLRRADTIEIDAGKLVVDSTC